MVDAAEDVPGTAGLTSDSRVLAIGITPRAHRRLNAGLGCELTDDLEDAGVALAVISTRVDRAEVNELVRSITANAGCPVVALTHPGGQETAVALLRGGAVAAVPEGEEGSIPAVVGGDASGDRLVETFVGRAEADDEPPQLSAPVDPGTGLPGLAAFELALADLKTSEEPLPRLLVLSAGNFDAAVRSLAGGVANLVRRRLLMGWRGILNGPGVRWFVLDDSRVAVLWPDGSVEDVDRRAPRMVEATAAFAPQNGRALRLAIGHAGPDDADTPATLRDLAERACDLAIATGRQTITADELIHATASRTELDTLLRAVEQVEQQDRYPVGHGSRVAAMAVTIGRVLDLPRPDLERLRLAARLHDVGKTALSAAAVAGAEELDGDALDEYRSHPLRGAQMLRPAAGASVAEAVQYHHEAYDGSGFPEGLTAGLIPLSARIIAVADHYDALTAGARGTEQVGTEAALDAIRELAGSRFDPDVVDALGHVLSGTSPIGAHAP